MRQIDKTLDKKRDAICILRKNRLPLPSDSQNRQKTIKLHNDEKNISAFQQEEKKQTRFPRENGHSQRSQGACFTQSQGTQEVDSI